MINIKTLSLIPRDLPRQHYSYPEEMLPETQFKAHGSTGYSSSRRRVTLGAFFLFFAVSRSYLRELPPCSFAIISSFRAVLLD